MFNSDSAPHLVKAASRWFAVECNNRAWQLLENILGGKIAASPDSSDADSVLHFAHAACLHWLESGGMLEHHRALVLLANAHAHCGSPDLAARYAAAAQQQFDANPDAFEDWDAAFLADAHCRSAIARGEQNRADELREQAKSLGQAIADPNDREFFQQWFATQPE